MTDPLPAAAAFREVLRPWPSHALGALLEVEFPADVLPPLWHWVHLLATPPQHLLGPDGHPTVGVPTPPGPGRRRMFAGGSVTTLAPLRYGEEAVRRVSVVGSEQKQGSTGLLEFVKVRHEIVQHGQLAVVEENDIVYREAGSTVVAPSSSPVTPAVRDRWSGPSWTLAVDETLLFRFSALTYNSHRIHYDLAWAAFERYDGLVVHGPLQVLAMAELARREGVDLVGQRLRYRLLRPMVGVQDMKVDAGLAESTLQVRDAAGQVTARADWSPVTTEPPTRSLRYR